MIVLISIIAVAGFYIYATRTAPRPIYGPFCTAAFLAGCATIAAALGPPLDDWAEARLSAHMIQHELLMVIAAPLLALGRAHWAILSMLARKRRGIAARIFAFLRWSPFAAWVAHALAVWVWHTPVLFEAALAHPWLHALQHASFLGTALLFWWSVLDRRSDYGVAAFYVFATSVHTSILGALLFFSPHPWYSVYAGATNAIEDQQLAGLIMWVPGGFVLAASALLLISHWLREAERRTVARERLTLEKSHSHAPLAVARGGKR
jgi:cytochrome c oxidase assembly factor CtaG